MDWPDIHKGSVYDLTIAHTGSSGSTGLFATCSNDKNIRLGKLPDPTSAPPRPVQGMAGGGLVGMVHALTPVASLKAPLKGHTGTIRCLRFSPTGPVTGPALSGQGGTAGPAFLASGGGGDCRARLWDVSTGSLIHVYRYRPTVRMRGRGRGRMRGRGRGRSRGWGRMRSRGRVGVGVGVGKWLEWGYR